MFLGCDVIENWSVINCRLTFDQKYNASKNSICLVGSNTRARDMSVKVLRDFLIVVRTGGDIIKPHCVNISSSFFYQIRN